jgi:hypothetical protein
LQGVANYNISLMKRQDERVERDIAHLNPSILKHKQKLANKIKEGGFKVAAKKGPNLSTLRKDHINSIENLIEQTNNYKYMFFYKDPYLYDPSTTNVSDNIMNKLRLNLAHCCLKEYDKEAATMLLESINNPDFKVNLNRLKLIEEYRLNRKLKNQVLDSLLKDYIAILKDPQNKPSSIEVYTGILNINKVTQTKVDNKYEVTLNTPKKSRKELLKFINDVYEGYYMLI